jgi:hypothetical protein
MPEANDTNTDHLTVDVVEAFHFDGYFTKALVVCGGILTVVFLVGVALGVMIAA